MEPTQWANWNIVLVSLVGYLCLVRLFRWRRYNAMIRCYAGRPLESITPEEAQQIIHVSSLYDMPMIDYVSTPSTLRVTVR